MDVNFRRYPVLLLAVSGLAACVAVGPDYAPPAQNIPPGWSRSEAGGASFVPGAHADELSQWWKQLNDPLLNELVGEALLASPDLRVARARLHQARGRLAQAAAERLPAVTASGSGRRSRSSGESGGGATHELFAAGFDASWELDLFGGLRRGVEAAAAELEASEASRQGVRVSLVAEVGLNYVEVRSLQSRLRIARANLASQSETLQLTAWRFQAGLVSSQDVEQARSNLEQTRARIPGLEIALAEAEHRLDILLGKSPGTLHSRLAGEGELPALPERIAVAIPAEALRQRPDVQAAERTLAAETARVGVMAAARYPAFRLSGSIGVEALSLSGLARSGAATSSLLAGITAPVFDAGRLRNQVAIQDAVREQALVAYEQAVLNALQEVENALVAFVRNREREQALAAAVESARSAGRLARQRYSAGLTDFQSVLDTDRSVLSVEDSLASTRADSITALILLYKALGGGWSLEGESEPSGKETS